MATQEAINLTKKKNKPKNATSRSCRCRKKWERMGSVYRKLRKLTQLLQLDQTSRQVTTKNGKQNNLILQLDIRLSKDRSSYLPLVCIFYRVDESASSVSRCTQSTGESSSRWFMLHRQMSLPQLNHDLWKSLVRKGNWNQPTNEELYGAKLVGHGGWIGIETWLGPSYLLGRRDWGLEWIGHKIVYGGRTYNLGKRSVLVQHCCCYKNRSKKCKAV